MQLICVRPTGSLVPGDPVEVPDGAEYSALYYAEAGTPEAAAAATRAAEAKAAAAAAAKDKAGPPPAGTQQSAAKAGADTPKAGA